MSNGVIVIRGARRATPVPSADQPSEGESSGEPETARTVTPERRSQMVMVRDSNGRQVETGTQTVETQAAGGSTTHTVMAVDTNGREAPSAATKERIVSRNRSGQVSERTIQRYDVDGRQASQEVVRVETKRLPDGTKKKIETEYRPDVNGRLQAAEQRVSLSKTSGGVSTTTVTTQKPSLNGNFRPFIQ